MPKPMAEIKRLIPKRSIEKAAAEEFHFCEAVDELAHIILGMSGDRKHWAYQAIAEMKQIVHDIEKAEADRE